MRSVILERIVDYYNNFSGHSDGESVFIDRNRHLLPELLAAAAHVDLPELQALCLTEMRKLARAYTVDEIRQLLHISDRPPRRARHSVSGASSSAAAASSSSSSSVSNPSSSSVAASSLSSSSSLLPSSSALSESKFSGSGNGSSKNISSATGGGSRSKKPGHHAADTGKFTRNVIDEDDEDYGEAIDKSSTSGKKKPPAAKSVIVNTSSRRSNVNNNTNINSNRNITDTGFDDGDANISVGDNVNDDDDDDEDDGDFECISTADLARDRSDVVAVDSAQCGVCSRPFSLLLRKHHCRECGAACCADCCNNFVVLPKESVESLESRIGIHGARKAWSALQAVLQGSMEKSRQCVICEQSTSEFLIDVCVCLFVC